MTFEKIKYYYEAGLWNAGMVKTAVKKGIITKAQYTEITGLEYEVAANKTAAERTAEALEAIANGQTSESTAVMNALLSGEEA